MASQKNRPVLFGTPLVVACTPVTPCRQVYEAVWRGVERLIIPDRPSADKENGYAVIHADPPLNLYMYMYAFTSKSFKTHQSSLQSNWLSMPPAPLEGILVYMQVPPPPPPPPPNEKSCMNP